MVFDLLMRMARKAKAFLIRAYLSYPRRVQCNVCGWEGRHFQSDAWHKHINCPRCRTTIRQRLFFAALENLPDLSFEKVIQGKAILHFAPENTVDTKLRARAASYTSADLLRSDCDLKLDMTNMPEVKDASVDAVIAFDVLEHVPDTKKALAEVHRILTTGGYAIFTVPQKDGLQVTYEDPTVVTPEERIKHFGQCDHLRIFGDDFTGLVERAGFLVTAVDERMFSEQLNTKHVLFPPVLSTHPLATNHRKVFFCQKRTN